MTTYLALRHTSPKGFFPGLFAQLTKTRLVTDYPHSGIVVDGVLYEATFKHGVRSTKFDPVGWDLFAITKVDKNDLLTRFKQVEGRPYDWFSLLAFIAPFRVTVAKWFYCFELCSFMLDGNIPAKRITPEILLRKVC
jgi:hypothetical protein